MSEMWFKKLGYRLMKKLRIDFKSFWADYGSDILYDLKTLFKIWVIFVILICLGTMK